MAHTLIHDPDILRIMHYFGDYQLQLSIEEDPQDWSLSWPLLRLWFTGQIKWEGITDEGWQQLESFYEWLIQMGMDPVF